MRRIYLQFQFKLYTYDIPIVYGHVYSMELRAFVLSTYITRIIWAIYVASGNIILLTI